MLGDQKIIQTKFYLFKQLAMMTVTFPESLTNVKITFLNHESHECEKNALKISEANYMVTMVFSTDGKWFHTKNRQNYDSK